jgi:putative ABC transport system permease protein
VEDQSKGLLGADLVVTSRQDPTPETTVFLDALGAEYSDQVMFSSMVLFPSTGGTRLVQVRGAGGDFPYYGEVETAPRGAWEQFQSGEGFLLEESLMLQFGANLGDPVKIGKVTRPVIGTLLKVPGDNAFFANIAPRVFVPMSLLDETELLGEKSLARYSRYYQFEDEELLEQAVDSLRDRREEFRLGFDTVEERKEELGAALTNLHRFLNLVAFVALLLGAIGIASAIQVHVQQRLDSVAVLRCLGATARQSFTIYLIQGTAMGLIGATTGTVIGVAVQQFLPRIFADVVPIEIALDIQWVPVLEAAGMGLLISILFALLPLMRIRRVSPLAVLRRDVQHSTRKDHPLLALYGVVLMAVLGFTINNSEKWEHGLFFTLGLMLALLVMGGVSKIIVWFIRQLRLTGLPFVWRQGLASLHRPNNRTLLLMISLGLGTFLILTLYLAQFALVSELLPQNQSDRPNAILFDIQPDQRAGVEKILTDQGLPLIGVSPVVSMRLSGIKGLRPEEARRDGDRRIPRWVIQREYRSTYRDSLVDSEQMVSGKWVKSASIDDGIIPISLEQGIAGDLGVDVGDALEFDVQGIPLKTRVANLRTVNWQRVQANFFVVFPVGVLEDAPGFTIITTRVVDSAESARMQREVVQAYPNVSAIDITLILKTVETIVSKITFGIRFMALFTVFTGVILLITAVLNTRYQRLQEGILLRTLGATSRDIIRIQAVEFLWLGILASLTGILLALGAQFLLTKYVFRIDFTVPYGQLLIAMALNVALTTGIGFITNRGVLKRPPLEILRSE